MLMTKVRVRAQSNIHNLTRSFPTHLASDYTTSDTIPADLHVNDESRRIYPLCGLETPLTDPLSLTVRLPSSFLSTHRRARAQSQAVPPRIPHVQISAPRTPARRTLATTSLNITTPPSRPLDIQQFKLKGSFTEPPKPRRRPAFGAQVCPPSRMKIQLTQPLHQPNTDLFDPVPNESAYAPYPQFLTSPTRPVGLPLLINDPFIVGPTLSTITESVQQHYQPRPLTLPRFPLPPNVPSCTVCGRSSGPLAILKPCSHPLCSACLTSALNIVGEKDMACAVCQIGVEDFQLQGASSTPPSLTKASTREAMRPSAESSPKRSSGGMLLPSAFDPAESPFGYFDEARTSLTPVPGLGHHQGSINRGENVVLRIDNVPWVRFF
jgi:hypothetical protein